MNSLFDFQLPFELSTGSNWLYLLQAVVFLWLGSIAFAAMRKVSLARQLAEKDNPAFAISYAGFMAALALVICSVIQSPSAPGLTAQSEFFETIFWTFGSLILLLVALLINDFVIFPKFKNRKEILEDRNTGLAVVEASGFLGTALLIRASLSPQLDPVELGEPWLTLLYFVVGQALFLLYSKVYPKAAGLDLHGELEKDNPAVGIAFGGSLLAFALLLGSAKMKYDALPTLIFLALVYLAVLTLARFAIHLIFSKKLSLAAELQRDRNWGMGILEATLSLALASLLIASLS
ncbi:DUF350 domain-containing protein [Verrucomicrobiaceae bacterium 227]